MNVQAGVQYASDSTDSIATVQFGVPLQVFDRNQGNIRRAYAELLAAQHQLRKKELDLRNRLSQVFAEYLQARQQVAAYKERIIPTAKRTLDLVQAGFRAGELDYLSVLTAQRTFSRTSLAYLGSVQQARQAVFEIEGLLLTGSLRDQP